MANNIFDWDDEEVKKAEEDVLGVYPRVEPPEVIVPPPSDPPAPSLEPDWETETVMRPQPEPWQPYSPFQQEPPQNTWIEYPPDAFDQPPEQQPGVWSEYKADSPDETARKGGLAWSAGIVFFSSVAFMLFLGWIADWLFGSSPWGLIGGIVLGSIMGFIQFFRISSRIFNPKSTENAERPLMTRDDGPV